VEHRTCLWWTKMAMLCLSLRLSTPFLGRMYVVKAQAFFSGIQWMASILESEK
jgi:hypothetical protein